MFLNQSGAAAASPNEVIHEEVQCTERHGSTRKRSKASLTDKAVGLNLW